VILVLDAAILSHVLKAQRNELTQYHLYTKLAGSHQDPQNRKVLLNIAEKEQKHHDFWRELTHQDVKPIRWKIRLYALLVRIFGITFVIRLMEQSEKFEQNTYTKIVKSVPEAQVILDDEYFHEEELIQMLSEERLEYTGAIVLGLNDALVELIGALSGFTFVLTTSLLIGFAGLITGIAATLSMATSEYQSIKSQNNQQKPLKAALYAGSAYFLTVLFLIVPYFVINNVYLALGSMIIIAIALILFTTFYISVVQRISFKERALKSIVISLGIAGLIFIIGFLIRTYLGL
jgi:VIT1/CCC1 family predicted Fe2+/Mn2+ transporter